MCMHASFNIKNEIYKLQYFNVKRKFKIKKEGRIEVNIFHIWLLFFCFVLLISKWLTTFIITNGKWMFAYFLIKKQWTECTYNVCVVDDELDEARRQFLLCTTMMHICAHKEHWTNFPTINSHFQYLILTVFFCYHVQKSEKNPKKHRKRKREKKMDKTIKQIVRNACKNKHRLIDW